MWVVKKSFEIYTIFVCVYIYNYILYIYVSIFVGRLQKKPYIPRSQVVFFPVKKLVFFFFCQAEADEERLKAEEEEGIEVKFLQLFLFAVGGFQQEWAQVIACYNYSFSFFFFL